MFRVSFASAPRDSIRPNEDVAAATAQAARVIDGAGTPAGAKTGCSHSVRWYSHALGNTLIGRLANTNMTLTDCLAEAIDEVRTLHGSGCDLNHPGSPSATVTTIREHDNHLEYLVLADSPLVLDLSDRVHVVCDDRVARLRQPRPAAMDHYPVGSPEHTAARHEYVGSWRSLRNREGGFWFASTTPDAAAHALTGALTLPA